MELHEAVMQFSKVDTPQRDTKPEDSQDDNKTEAAETEGFDDQETTTEAAPETDVESTETPSSDTEVETYEVPYDGETLQLTLDELKKGYMRERDYQYKRQEDAKIAKAAQAKLDKLETVLTDIELDVKDESQWFKTDEAKELRELDPDEYLKRLDSFEQKKARRDSAKRARDEELREQQSSRIAEEREKLKTAIPDWLDPDTQAKDLKAISKILIDAGYTEDEMKSLTDHRQYKLLRRLAQLEAIQNQDVSSKKVTKTVKSATPGSAEDQEDSKTKKRKELHARLRKTGRLEDAAALLRS